MATLKIHCGINYDTPVTAEFTFEIPSDGGKTYPIKIGKNAIFLPSPEHADIVDGVNGWDLTKHGYKNGISSYYASGEHWTDPTARLEKEASETPDEWDSIEVSGHAKEEYLGQQTILNVWIVAQSVNAHFLNIDEENAKKSYEILYLKTSIFNSMSEEEKSGVIDIAKNGKNSRYKAIFYEELGGLFIAKSYSSGYAVFVCNSGFTPYQSDDYSDDSIYYNSAVIRIKIDKNIGEGTPIIVTNSGGVSGSGRIFVSITSRNFDLKLYNSSTSKNDIVLSSIAEYEGTDKDGDYTIDGTNSEGHGTSNIGSYVFIPFPYVKVGGVYLMLSGRNPYAYEKTFLFGNYIRKISVKVSNPIILTIHTKEVL